MIVDFFCLFSFLKAFSNESSQLVSAATSSAPLATEISSLSEDSTMKAGKLTAEQRKEKIHRYMKKRNERNFSKKIKVIFFNSPLSRHCMYIYNHFPSRTHPTKQIVPLNLRVFSPSTLFLS